MSGLFLIANDPLAASSLRTSLESPGLQVVGWATTLAQACETIEDLKPNLVLSDLELVDGPFADWIGEFGKSRYGRPMTMVLAASFADGRVMEAMRQGADGYHLLSDATESLASAVKKVLAGEAPMAPEIASEILEYFEEMTWERSNFVAETQNTLRPSDGDLHLLRLIADGRSLVQIARDAQTTPNAIGQRVRLLYRKLRYDTSAATLTLKLL